jgi:hypothetical protein
MIGGASYRSRSAGAATTSESILPNLLQDE